VDARLCQHLVIRVFRSGDIVQYQWLIIA
jgi:hypothetical protein